MSEFNEGLRIEVENDLFQKEGERAVEKEDTEMNPASPYASEKEDGELSGNNSPIRDEGEISMEVDGMDAEDGRSRRGSSHSLESRMPRSSSLEKVYRPRTYQNPFLNDVLVSEEKLNSRAARFGIAPASQGNSGPRIEPLPSDSEVLSLYLQIGLVEDDGGEPSLDKVGAQYRLDSILIRGTNQMSTNEIFEYLRDNNQRPLEMEWVNDACCVVIFKDRYEAARAIMTMTKPIVVEPRPERKETDDGGLEPEDISDDFDYHADETVSSKYITVPMPPGYTWRFAVPCRQARGILMRYAATQDKKQEKSERHSEYYKKFGNPNYAGFGLVTQSFRNRLKKQKSLEIPQIVEPEVRQPISNRTAWSQLSQRWNDEEIAAAEGRSTRPSNPQPKASAPINPPALVRRNDPVQSFNPLNKSIKVLVDFEDRGSSNIKSRLKRPHVPPPRNDYRKADEDDNSSDSDEDSKWSKKLKGPRMRMHADEEEQRMKDRLRRQGGNRGRSGNPHSRVNNRLSWPGSYRPRGNFEDGLF